MNLLPCPFCGGKVKIEDEDWFIYGSKIKCQCGVDMSGGDPHSLAADWNKRVNLKVKYPDSLCVEKANIFDKIKLLIDLVD